MGIPVDYMALIRLRLSLAVSFSAVTGYCIFGSIENSVVLLAAGVFLLAAGASALNQIAETEQDSLMQRTADRPLPTRRIRKNAALIFSICMLCTGTFLLLLTGITPALLGIINVIIYVFIYTLLKRITPMAIIPGALVGAIPPLIGFTAAGGTLPTEEILLFSGFMFLWQLPHFWLIIIKYRDDYHRAGFKTFSGNITEKTIRNLVFMWVILSSLILLVFMINGFFFHKTLMAILIPLNVIFISLFYRMLYNSFRVMAIRQAFILVNSFGLMIMLMFIINAFI